MGIVRWSESTLKRGRRASTRSASNAWSPAGAAPAARSASTIPVSSARAGDLYFWSSNGLPSGIHHVALALGGGQFIEAPHTGAYVRYNSVYAWYPNCAVRL